MSVLHRRHHQLAVGRRAPASSDILGSVFGGGNRVETTATTLSPSSKNEPQTTSTTQQPPTSQKESNTSHQATTTAQSTPPTSTSATSTSQTTSSTSSTTVITTPTSTTSTPAQQTQTQQTQQTHVQQDQNNTDVSNPNKTITQTRPFTESSATISPTAGARHSSNSSASQVGKTIGIIAGVIGGIAALCIVIGFIMRRLRKRRDREAADAIANDFSASEFRKSAVMISDSSSTRSSPRPPSVIERRIAAHNNPGSGYGTGGLQPGGYGQQGGYFERSSFYDNQYEGQYAQQYVPPPHSPTSLDPFMSGSPVISSPPPAASTPAYLPRPASPTGSFANQFSGGLTLSPGVYVPGTMQAQQELVIDNNRMSTASSILINPHDSVAFGAGAVNMSRQGSWQSVPGSPTTVAPAQGLEAFLQREPEPAKQPAGNPKKPAGMDTHDAYGGV